VNDQALVPALGPSQARLLTNQVKRDAEALWRKLVELYEGGAHSALGYSSWGEYFAAEFGQSARRGYQLLDAGRALAAVNHGSLAPPNERQARELVPLLREEEEDAVVDLWVDLRDEFGERLTADNVRSAVEKKLRPRVATSTPAAANGDRPRENDELIRARDTLARAYEKAGQLVAEFLEAHPDEDRERVCKQIAPNSWQALDARVRRRQAKV